MTKQDFDNFVFDFNSLEEGTLNENMMNVFGAWIQYLLEKMFKGAKIPVRVRGDKIQVMRFTNALVHEKRYMNAIKKYGLDNPMTYKSRLRLDKAIQKFEKEVGINWPLK